MSFGPEVFVPRETNDASQRPQSQALDGRLKQTSKAPYQQGRDQYARDELIQWARQMRAWCPTLLEGAKLTEEAGPEGSPPVERLMRPFVRRAK